ncbi:hypothetical protein T440DRAFT_478812 [Plenodomus tracheiphilus IPT5]|uniref:Uncharacterized protein n=1 Tax=Plenodomus tracheiphilus IPT5 TaxID=1408161 RepID=A0A6A7B6N9_9PLEO|nr:hypothetical protein T440DRAFT_478812 [Plenodomus tracheiphilus IPT5]
MNIIHSFKTYHKHQILNRERTQLLSKIPQSQLAGIEALPLELWGQIINYVLDPHLQRQTQCYTLPQVLKLRLVCLCGRSKTGKSSHQLIIHRIKNCARIARCIDRRNSVGYRDDLIRTFCTSASTSRSCWHYILEPVQYIQYVDDRVAHFIEDDLLLEAALLVANGYQFEDVKMWMVRLGRRGLLTGYRGRCRKICSRCGNVHYWEEGGGTGRTSFPMTQTTEEEISDVITNGMDWVAGEELEEELEQELDRLRSDVRRT